jgi:hypothetical protein
MWFTKEIEYEIVFNWFTYMLIYLCMLYTLYFLNNEFQETILNSKIASSSEGNFKKLFNYITTWSVLINQNFLNHKSV